MSAASAAPPSPRHERESLDATNFRDLIVETINMNRNDTSRSQGSAGHKSEEYNDGINKLADLIIHSRLIQLQNGIEIYNAGDVDRSKITLKRVCTMWGDIKKSLEYKLDRIMNKRKRKVHHDTEPAKNRAERYRDIYEILDRIRGNLNPNFIGLIMRTFSFYGATKAADTCPFIGQLSNFGPEFLKHNWHELPEMCFYKGGCSLIHDESHSHDFLHPEDELWNEDLVQGERPSHSKARRSHTPSPPLSPSPKRKKSSKSHGNGGGHRMRSGNKHARKSPKMSKYTRRRR